MNSAVEIMDTGFSCLVARLGVVDAERFVAMIFICNSPGSFSGVISYHISFRFIL